MAHATADSSVNSLKGKIRLASIALGGFVACFGVFAHFVQALLVADIFYSVFVPFALLAVLLTIWGWRFAAHIAEPVENVSLLAKSFERGTTTALPKTTGASETDELLQTVHRLSRQTKKIVEAMDRAADGDTGAALAVELGSDKSSQAFQKLLARISESIRAKQDLERLSAEVTRLSDDVSGVREGDLTASAESRGEFTRELSETLNFLIARLSALTEQTRGVAPAARDNAAGAVKILSDAAREDESRIRELNRASVALKQAPQAARKISENLAAFVASADQAAEKARHGARTAQENLESIGSLRRKIQETVRRTHRLRERSREIENVVKTIEDLGRRATLVSLNASIQSSEMGEAGRGFGVVSGEIERLAARADETGKAVASLGKAVQSEIGEVEMSLESAFGDAATLSKAAIETGGALGELEKYVGRFLNLQKELTDDAGAHSEETEKAFRVLTNAIAETAERLPLLKAAAESLDRTTDFLEDLQESAADLKIPAPAVPERAERATDLRADFVEFQLTGD